MSKQFKVGDRVVLVSHGLIGWEARPVNRGREWTREDELHVGGTYTVSKVSKPDEDFPWIEVEEGMMQYGIHPDHFQHADPQTDTGTEGEGGAIYKMSK